MIEEISRGDSSPHATKELGLSVEISSTDFVSVSETIDFARGSCAGEYFFGSIDLGSGESFCFSGIDINRLSESSLPDWTSASFLISIESLVTHVQDISVGVVMTKMFSVSGPFDVSFQSGASDNLLRSISLRPSHAFAFPRIEIGRGSRSFDRIEISVALMNSSKRPCPEVLPAVSLVSIQFGFDESGLISSSFPSDADRASRGFSSAAVGTALAVGVLLLIMLVAVLIFWFATGRRTETDVTDAAEFAIDRDDSLGPPDPMDQDDYWAENLGLITAVNALGSATLGADIPFPDFDMTEEGLWMDNVSPRRRWDVADGTFRAGPA
jgi:hypothetical protein